MVFYLFTFRLLLRYISKELIFVIYTNSGIDMKDIILEMNILFQKSNQSSTVFINDRDKTTSELPNTLKQLTIQPSSKFVLFGFKYRKIVWLMEELQETPHP